MTTTQELITAIRNDLQDLSETNPRWSDDALYQWALDAAADYSQYFPRRIDDVVLELNGDSYVLPNDFVWDISVECPRDTFLEKRRNTPGLVFRPTTTPRYYSIDGGRLYLSSEPSDDVYLSYYAIHVVPSITDVEMAITIPASDIELIRLYVSAKAHAQMRAKQARLDRFDIGSGRRDDNPVTPEVTNEMKDYMAKINARLRGGVIPLYRPRRGAS